MKRIFSTFTLFAVAIFARAQYAPAAGQTGTTAMYLDSSAFINWAYQVIEFTPGLQDTANTSSGFVDFGTSDEALSQAEGNSSNVVSLGDGGRIILGFQYPIKNESGPDFAVFENSFSDTFLELGHVEVSTDGVHFVRIPSVSLTSTTTQVGSFGSVDPTLIHNLAGKYRQGYGTPFDLEDIIDSTGVNLDSINYVKIIDVVGSIDTQYGTEDSQGNIINDPYPTAFNSGGFDLDAVGVIHENNELAGVETETELSLKIYPNPVFNQLFIEVEGESIVEIYSLNGQLMILDRVNNTNTIDVSQLNNGVYIIKCRNKNSVTVKKIMIKH